MNREIPPNLTQNTAQKDEQKEHTEEEERNMMQG